jgi:hypothetical protein
VKKQVLDCRLAGHPPVKTQVLDRRVAGHPPVRAQVVDRTVAGHPPVYSAPNCFKFAIFICKCCCQIKFCRLCQYSNASPKRITLPSLTLVNCHLPVQMVIQI